MARFWPPVLVGIVIRLAFALLVLQRAPASTLAPDSARYLELAGSLRADGSFRLNGRPELERTPGYPAVLVPALAAANPPALIVMGQVLVSAATIGLTISLALLLFRSDRIAGWAGWLVAIDPISILYPTRVLSETWYTLLLVVAAIGLVRVLRSASLLWAAGAGLAVAVATFVRPVGVAALAAMATALGVTAWASWRRPQTTEPAAGRGRPVAAFAAFLVLAAGPLLGWIARNRTEAGYSQFSSIGAVNLYFYVGAALAAPANGTTYYDLQRRWGYRNEPQYRITHPDQDGWTDAERYRWMAAEAGRLIRAEPARAARLQVAGIARTLLDPGATEFLRSLGAYPAQGGLLGKVVERGLIATLAETARERPLLFWSNLLAGLLLLGYLGLAAAAWAGGPLWREPAALALAGVIVATLMVSGGPAATNRLRAPLVPIICVFAARSLAHRSPAAGRRAS